MATKLEKFAKSLTGSLSLTEKSKNFISKDIGKLFTEEELNLLSKNINKKFNDIVDGENVFLSGVEKADKEINNLFSSYIDEIGSSTYNRDSLRQKIFGDFGLELPTKKQAQRIANQEGPTFSGTKIDADGNRYTFLSNNSGTGYKITQQSVQKQILDNQGTFTGTYTNSKGNIYDVVPTENGGQKFIPQNPFEMESLAPGTPFKVEPGTSGGFKYTQNIDSNNKVNITIGEDASKPADVAETAVAETNGSNGRNWVRYAVGAATGGGLVLALSDRGGQQTNAQLYGQQPLY